MEKYRVEKKYSEKVEKVRKNIQKYWNKIQIVKKIQIVEKNTDRGKIYIGKEKLNRDSEKNGQWKKRDSGKIIVETKQRQ